MKKWRVAGHNRLYLYFGAGLSLASLVGTFTAILLVWRGAAFNQPQGEPWLKYVGMAISLLLGMTLTHRGLMAIKNQRTIGERCLIIFAPREYTGNTAVLIGMQSCVASGVVMGALLYWFVF
jgi:hypothetical protein